MDMRSWKTWTFLAAAAVAAGCAEPGERARGGCPDGEVCSPKTPDGLYFVGPAFAEELLSEGGPEPVALGGTQTVRVVTGRAAGSAAFDLPFDASTDGPAIGVDSVTPPSVRVVGLAEGAAHLRLTEPGTELLYDRVEIETRFLERVVLHPLWPTHVHDFEWFSDPDSTWAIYEGSTIDVVAKLYDESGDRLVDMSMVMGGGTQQGWDHMEVTAPLGGSLGLAVDTGDGTRWSTTIRVVSFVDEVVALDDMSEPLVEGELRTYCFRALSQGDLVAGVEWDFTGTADIRVDPVAGANCTHVTGLAPGVATLTVHVSGADPLPFDIVVEDASSKPRRDVSPPSFDEIPEPSATPGDRALSASLL